MERALLLRGNHAVYDDVLSGIQVHRDEEQAKFLIKLPQSLASRARDGRAFEVLPLVGMVVGTVGISALSRQPRRENSNWHANLLMTTYDP